jgi:mRNA interferase HigB
MRIIARRTLREFVGSLAGHKDQKAVRAALDGWFAEVRKADWKASSDVKKSDARASILSADRIVFDIKGGGYRLIAAVDFEKRIVWVKWIGTHEEYDRIDARKVKYER